jgi:hypothetical protein
MFPEAPRIIPDGGISPVRLATMAFLWQPSLSRRGSSARPHTPRTTWFAPRLVANLPLSTLLRLCVRWWCRSSTAMTESPFASLRRYLAEGSVCRSSIGVTQPSSLVWAHAPDPAPPPACGHPSVWGSVQVAASPCCGVALPDVISACLSLDAWTLTPAAWWVHWPITSPPPSAFPQSSWGRLTALIRSATSEREVMSELQSFTHVQASRFAATQVAPTAVSKHGAAVACTSEQNTGRCLPVHRIC